MDVGTNACLCVTFLLDPAKVIFGKPVLSLESVHDEVLAISYTLQKCCVLSRPRSLNCPSPYISFILSLSLSLHAHSQAGRKSTHTFSLNTLNLNSLLIRRYVTSLTLPSSPSFSVHTPSPAEFNPLSKPALSCFLPSPFFIYSRLSTLFIFSPLFLSASRCLPPSEEPVSTRQPPLKTVSNLKVN